MSALNEQIITQTIRPRFSRVLARDEVYLANHSLGRPLDVYQEDVIQALDAWPDLMDEAWSHWMKVLNEWTSGIAQLLHWPVSDGIIPKSSAGQGLRAVLNAYPNRPVKVVSTTLEFDSIDFVLKAYAEHGAATIDWVQPSTNEQGIPKFTAEDVLRRIAPGTDLVVLSLVFFTTGQVMPGVQEIITKAHSVGAKVVLDSYHAAGVIDFNYPEADFIVGGSYKYLRGGPGACFLAVNPACYSMKTLDTGWFAKKDPFEFKRENEPLRSEGGWGWYESTFSVIPLAQALPGLRFLLEVGVQDSRDYNLQTLGKIREILAPYGGFVPENPDEWAGYALFATPEFKEVIHRFRDEKIVVDGRQGLVRFGPDILTGSEDLNRLAEAARKVLHS